MKLRIWMQSAVVCLALGGATGYAASYYVNDNSTSGDIYTSATGNDANSGTAVAPKLTLGNVIGTCSLQPGDVVYIDTGSYPSGTIISNTVVGTNGNPIVFQGSTNFASGGTTFTGSGDLLTVYARYAHFRDIRCVGGSRGLVPYNAAYCEFVRIQAISNVSVSVQTFGTANSNVFRHCVLVSQNTGISASGGKGNYFDSCVAVVPNGTFCTANIGVISNMVGCIGVASSAFGLEQYVPDGGSRNLFFTTNGIHQNAETVFDLQRIHTNWYGNTYGDPMFVNSTGLDFHVQSAAGFLSNGVWVTNAALGYSPAIDFGPVASTAYTNEPAPNGGRVNIGRYAGTEEASKGRTNDWLFAMSFNDGGALVQTGRLEWVGGNLGAGTVNLQMSTNAGASWSNIATGVPATNESYVWVPTLSQQHPAVLWRVVSSTNTAAVSTNAKPFSVRVATNASFTYYVNDGSLVGDVYCSGIGDNAYNGLTPATPKRSLQAILEAYVLAGGDTVYVDTGNYATNFTTSITSYDTGSTGKTVRIIGSPDGSVLSSSSTSRDTLEVSVARFIEISNFQLTGPGRYGFYGNGVADLVVRNVLSTANRWGFYLAGTTYQNLFDGCLAADSELGAFFAGVVQTRSNHWVNGVMWGGPTLISAHTNAPLSVSNSILGGATTLFGTAVVPGDYNLVWDVQVGLGYSTFSALQNAGLGRGWDWSLFADPQFADEAGGDYHLKSLMGRYDPDTETFVTNDAVHSPAIDFGHPLSTAYTNEPSPNGSRLNAGLYGGTAQASKSRTNAWLQTLSYMDGGTLDAVVGSWLRWNGGAYASTSTVTISLSRDNGASWTNLAVGVSATNGAYWYQNTSTNDPSSLFSLWKVTLDGASPEVFSQTPTNFSYKNGAFSYYLNDGSTSGDVYCTAVGNDGNLGVTPGAPMETLGQLLVKYKLGPGDRVYVDTGSFTNSAATAFTSQDSGLATNPVVILGSTNRVAGGSVFGRPTYPLPTTLGFVFQAGASNITLRNIVLTNMVRGVAVSNASGITLDGVEVRGGLERSFDLMANARDVELVRCVAHGGGIGAYLQQVTNVTIHHSVFWQNKTNAIYVGSQVGALVENSVLASTNGYSALISLASPANGFSSDYNGLYAGEYARVGANRTSGGYADNLAAWQALSGGRDVHSVPGNPQLADPGQFDYHLKTEQTLGRRLPNGQQISDSVSSPLLDAGNPASDVADEPAPNGSRVNIGKYGGTWEASIALATPWLKTVSFGDAGGVTNGVVSLLWTAGGGFTTETVKVEVSVDGGNTWGTMVTSGIPATNGMADWTVSGLPDTPAGAWRVVCLESTNVWARSTNFFAIRNSPLNIFVNNADTNETVYTTAPGTSNNWTAASNAPLNSVVTVFERFDLEAGDQIWVDTGAYGETVPVMVGLKDSGASNNPVRVIGNQSLPYSGTVLSRASRTLGAYVVQLSYAQGVQFSSLMISNAYIGIHAESSTNVTLERVRVGYCVTNSIYAGNGAGMQLRGSIVEQSLSSGLFAFTGSAVRVHNSLLRDNTRANLFIRGGDVELKSSVLEASGSQRYVYYWGGGGRLSSDYNNIRVAEGANVAGGDTRSPDRFLIDWQISTSFSNDMSSFGYEARFADEDALDFHLESEYGRYDPAVGAFTTNDTETSRLIDLGDPASAYTNEPAPNGSRINAGLYGNTAEASKSPGTGSLVPLTMSDGGTIRGEAELYWAWNGIAANERVDVQFSADGGVTWTNIATNIYADVGSSGLTWITTNFPSTAMGVWQVMTTNGAIVGQTETLFAIKNDPLAYYVNDASTNGDIYCSAAGSAANTGLAADSPLTSLETLMGRYKVEPGDTVYVDTGIYSRSTPLVISVPSVAATNFLIIQGSTNEAAGGSVFTNSSGAVIDLQDTSAVELRDLRLHGGDKGLLFTQSSDNRILRVRSVGARGNAFELSTLSDQNQFIQCAALSFFSTGFHMAKTPSALLTPPATNYWINGVISPVPAASNGTAVSTGTLMGALSGRIYVSNSVFVANGPAHDIYVAASNVIRGDYNCYHRPYSNALIASVSVDGTVFGMDRMDMENLETWSAWNQSDSHSLAADPLFADLAGADVHPQSAGGRYSVVLDDFVEDPESSPLIDTADPTAAWSAESEPNGQRANLGIYGNNPQASRTPTNGTFVLLSLNQGGVARGTYTLRWQARGGATNAGHMVNIQLSTNSGASFQTIASSLATVGSYAWNSTAHPSIQTARWRVQSQSQASWVTVSERDFVIHNTNITFYVNDASTDDDVYSTAAGSEENTGLSPSSPLSSLADVLARYDVEPGDRILIDTGDYLLDSSATVGLPDSGTVAEPVTIQGSTNVAGSVFFGAGVQFENARGVTLRNIRFQAQTSSYDATMISRSEDIVVEQVDIREGTHNGVGINSSSNILLRNFSVAGMATNGVSSMASFNTRLEFGTLWSNGVAQVLIRNQLPSGYDLNREAAFVAVSNCVMGAFGVRVPAYEVRGTLYANYNNFYLVGGALAALSYEAGFGREFDSVGSWSSETGLDGMSLSLDPRFADAASGDFHLRSSAGRFDPSTGSFVLDSAATNSPLIDAGDPAIACIEPSPNGNRVNIGRYGNTAEASKTPTNGALTLISFNDGGRASGTNVWITWLARGVSTGTTVTISYSADGGSTWTLLTNGVLAATGYWIWDSTLSAQSVQGKLKIEGADGSVAQSSGLFAVRNAPFSFYINDNSTSNDVYCTAVGQGVNSGLSNNAPMADFNALLAKYDLEGGDVVYIDTGVYRGNDPWRITQADSAGTLDMDPVVFQGSTQSMVNGTVLERSFNAIGIQADYAVGIRLRNIAISNTVSSAVVFNDCYDAAAEWIAVGIGNIGFRLNAGSQLRVANSLVYNSNQGVLVENWTRATNTVFPVIEHNVFWETADSAIEVGGMNEATVQHNILSVAAGQYVYELGPYDELFADYNAIWLGSGGRVFQREQSRTVSPVPIIYDTVGAWASDSGQDLHSYEGDPLLANPAGLDFHLKSRGGRWLPAAGTWTNDAVSSPLIDAGDASSTAWTNEPSPNGSRLNIGLYGGTAWASKSITNSALHLLSLNRGGVASGQVSLNWSATGQATGHTVRIEVSIDNGATWTLVGAGIPAGLGGVVWNSSSQPSSPLALWRVQDEVEAGVSATSALNFVLHNGPVYYYVNDEFTDGDVYCSAVGSSTNTGVSPTAPKRWISEILDTYNLEAGDVVYVDTGRYQTSEPTTIGDLDAGDISQNASEQVNIVGSTNVVEGGSLYIISDPTVAGFQMDGTYGVRLSRIGIMGASNGLALDDSYFIAGEWLDISGCENGVNSSSSSNILFSHSAMVGNRNAGIYFSGNMQEGMRVESGLLWSNRYGLYVGGGYAEASNTIFGMVAPNSFGYYMLEDRPLTGISGDYNNLYVSPSSGGAAGGLQTGVETTARTSVYVSVSAWALRTGKDTHSLAHNPQLADPGNGDYHLKSAGGRYVPGSGWVYDSVSSPLIDAGSPLSTAWLLEPDPNGRRLNIGRYGGSPEASKTALGGWITLVTLNDGGYASGDVDLQWTVGGAASNYTVCLEYSPDNGITWTNIVCGWPAITGSYLWDSVPYGRSAMGLWRAFCVEDSGISAASQSTFILRNGGSIPYYVNDSSTTGDVYCTVIGDDANNGLTPATPKASLQSILDAYELAPEDVVYVDAGTYTAGAPPILINQTDSGWSNLYVTIQGSTNPAAPTVYVAPSFSTPHVFSLQYAVNVRLKDLTIRNASVGVETYQTIGCEFNGVRIENNRSVGLNLVRSEGTRLVKSVLWKNTSPTGGVAAVLYQSSIAVENSVIWGSPIAFSIGQSTLTVTNSVLDATGSGGRIYLFAQTASATNGFRGDYNNYSRKNGALICEQQTLVGGSDYYNDLPGWGAAVSSEQHSMTIDPAFANETSGDFHPQSTQGRFTGTAWTNDSTLSPLVDAGAPAWPSTNEPAPNGGIINIGAYGNTVQASMTQTNPPWLRAISYNDEGVMSGNVLLYWLHGGMPADTPVRLEYSTDYEISWHPIASNVLAGSREYLWDVSGMPLSLALNWRVTSQSHSNVWDVSDAPVVIKTGTYDYFVNDTNTSGDVWCMGPGLEWDPNESYGTNAATPLNSLASLFANYPVSAGDRVYVDTGVYPVTDGSRILLDDQNMGTAESPVRIYGSTNVQAGGTLLFGNGTANGFDIQNTRNIEIHDIRVANARNGIALQNVSSITLEGIEAFNNLTNGVLVSGGGDVEMRNSRLWNNRRYGYFTANNQSGFRNIQNSTFWGNAMGAVWNAGIGVVSVSNSILCVTNAVPVYSEDGSASDMAGDYNLYGTVSGATIGTNSSEKVSYANLRQWQAKDRDLHSVVTDPLFVDPTNGNFHLQSRAGYWSNGTWATSANTSWAIDAGDPVSLAVSNEPSPNGNRINLGAYGGTEEASHSDYSMAELLPTTLRDGGVAPNGQPLYWLYRGISSTNEIQIEYSPDGGATWILVDNGIQVGSAPYYWFSSVDPTPEALWRILLQSNTNVMGVTIQPFTLRTRALTYYVNDTNTAGDVYTTVIGASTNRGYVSNSPLQSIEAVLNRYQLAGGDQIKVDTGSFALSNSVFISLLNSGDSTNRIGIVGSTNLAAGGSWMQPAPGLMIPAFQFHGAHDVNLSNFRLSGFTNGASFAEGAYQCTISDLDIQGSVGAGVLMDKATYIRLDRVLLREGLANGIEVGLSRFVADGCVLWSNRLSAVKLGDSVLAVVSNSVLAASGAGVFCYEVSTGALLQADYNDLFIQGGAQISMAADLQYEKLPQWVKGSSQDRHSLSTDPLFHDPANGDFHLRSVAGRYQPGTGWVQDAPAAGTNDYSPLIDMSAARLAWSNEPTPNGSRRNIGLYGNTWQASKSNTNQWLQTVTAMSGGILYGGINLIWGYGGGIATNALLRLEYSYNNGVDWVRIGEAAAGAGEYYWQSDLKQAGVEIWLTSPGARWRLYLLGDTNVWDMTDTYFGLRNSPFKYYVNDTSTVNDVYTTAIGSDTNMGFYPAAPKLSLIALLGDVDLEPTDEVYVDTGVYHLADTNTPILWEASDGGEEGESVSAYGSTHADGSRFLATNRFSTGGAFFMEASYVDMQDLQFVGEAMEFKGTGLEIRNLALSNGSMRVTSVDSTFEDVQIDRGSLSLSGQGNVIDRLAQRWGETAIIGTNAIMRHSVIFTTNYSKTGVWVSAVGAVISNCTVVSTHGSAIGKLGYGTLRLGHNILVAGGTTTNSVIAWHDGGLISDWNNLLARDSAWMGQRNGKWEKLSYWQAASGQDANSVSFEPRFQNEASGDFHLNSEVGRWSPILGGWDVDPPGNHSPVIDLGDPWLGTASEPMPNGYRLNLGAYGGTEYASKSLSTLWLTALTQNDGGVLAGTNVVLRWAAGNAGGKTVTLQYYDGSTWTNIATGVSATLGTYAWNTVAFPDSFAALWRVVAEDGSGISDQTDSTFELRNQTHAFYVNDNDLTGDIYCSAIGALGNDGLTPATPKLSLQAILDAYDLEGGDTVYLDTGTYATNADIRIIWSRGGSTNADVVIQGNTNGAHTILTRSGSTNYPAAGIDVKASHVRLSHLAIRGVDRGIWLESNRNVTVEGMVVSDASTGVDVEGAHGTEIRNSALWKTGYGVSLENTRTSVLENLTFAGSTAAGIQMVNTVVDTLQNNIFIPAAGAYAYAVGTATSLLSSATMDYNLYDFGNLDSGFYAGTSNSLRHWQLGLNRDFRSAITNADLAEIEFTGDFHPKSEYGRWTPGGWTLDATTSWAVDHGYPDSDYSQEPTNNGERINIGMYGNTVQASQGSTNIFFEVRTLNEPGLRVSQSDQVWPLVWSAHLVDGAEWVQVQFSGDGGMSWTTLTNVSAYTEYYIWQATVAFQTAQGRWRVIGVTNTNLVDMNENDFLVQYRDLGILTRPYAVSGLMRFEWEGGIQGRRYEIRYSDDFGQTWHLWEPKYNGPAPINKSNFVIPVGGSQLSYTFEDRTSYLRRTRWYRIYQFDE